MKVKVTQLILAKTSSLCVVSREVKRDVNPENFLFPSSRFHSSAEVASCSVLVREGGRQHGDMQLLIGGVRRKCQNLQMKLCAGK